MLIAHMAVMQSSLASVLLLVIAQPFAGKQCLLMPP